MLLYESLKFLKSNIILGILKYSKAYSRKHIMCFLGLGIFDNTNKENFNSVRFKFGFNPTVRIKNSSAYVTSVPQAYTVLKFIYKPWEVGIKN